MSLLTFIAAIPSSVLQNLPSSSTPTFNEIINPILYFIGILAVIMVIYGGIQYTTSAGDAGKVAKAKNTLIWSIAGLAVAILAYAIVNFVIGIF